MMKSNKTFYIFVKENEFPIVYLNLHKKILFYKLLYFLIYLHLEVVVNEFFLRILNNINMVTGGV